eukprot:10595437-Lingulodinium_polyedra.AAC.1
MVATCYAHLAMAATLLLVRAMVATLLLVRAMGASLSHANGDNWPNPGSCPSSATRCPPPCAQ